MSGEEFDYRHLLKRYMLHVIDCESVNLLGYEVYDAIPLSDKELKELEKLNEECDGMELDPQKGKGK